MAIPKLKKQDIINALKFVDEDGVPEHNVSTKYVLVSEDGKKYPPKYVVAVADHLSNGMDISTESFNSVEAKSYLESLGFTIETKQQEKFELSITAEKMCIRDRIKLIYEMPEVIAEAGEKYEPSIVTRHIVDIAQAFNKFYHDEHILVDDETEKTAKVALVMAARNVIRNGLDLLGMKAPEKM